MSDITYKEYWDSVESIAQDVLEEFEVKTQEKYEDVRDSISDRLFEDVDSSQWIIYTGRNLKVIEFTDNRDAYQEIDNLDGSKGFDAICAQVAFFAMLRDVETKVSNLVEDLPADQDELEANDKWDEDNVTNKE